MASSITSSNTKDVPNKGKSNLPTVESESSSSTNSLKDLSPVMENLDLKTETNLEDDIAQIESRSHSAEPPRILRHLSGRHLSGQNDSLASLLPPQTRRQVHFKDHMNDFYKYCFSRIPYDNLNVFCIQRTVSTSANISTEKEPIIRTTRRTIYTAGRPPWYDYQGQLMEPFVIGICGGSASGKTTVANKIIKGR